MPIAATQSAKCQNIIILKTDVKVKFQEFHKVFIIRLKRNHWISAVIFESKISSIYLYKMLNKRKDAKKHLVYFAFCSLFECIQGQIKCNLLIVYL